jgi:hypothetical protein
MPDSIRLIHSTLQASIDAKNRWADAYADADHIPLYPLAMPAQTQALRLPEPLTDKEVDALIDETEGMETDRAVRHLVETGVRRVKEANDAAAAPTPPAQDDEALEVLKLALDALNCGDTGGDLEDSHRCGKCDEYVDRNAPVRQRIRAFIAKRGEK